MKKLLFAFFTLLTISNTFSQTPYPTRLTDTYCYNYNLPSLYSNFVAFKKPCDGYKYYVENQTTLDIDSLVTYGSVAGRVTNLSNFPGANIQYGTTYKISVRTWIGNPSNLSAPAAVDCYIVTPCGSELEESENGAIINYLYYDAIFAVPSNCTNVQDYQFRLREGYSPSTTSPYIIATGGTEATENAGDISVFLSDFGPITNFSNSNPYGKFYRISVRIKANGVWGPWGREKIVFTTFNPTVKLRDGEYPVAGVNQCGSSFSNPYTIPSPSSILAAYNLYGFSNYTFEVTELDGSGNDIVTKFLTREASDFGSMSRAFRLNMIEASSPTGTDGYWTNSYNTSFRVRVKTNLGNYGEACYVKVQNSGISTKPFPNPFNSTFSLKTETTSKVNIYDIKGQLVESSFQTRNLGENLPTGIYFIKFNGETIKVIKE